MQGSRNQVSLVHVLLVLLSLLYTYIVSADTPQIKTVTLQVPPSMSLNEAKEKAIRQLEVEALSEKGVFIKSKTTMSASDQNRDFEIKTTLESGGTTKTRIIKESFNGTTLHLEVEIAIDIKALDIYLKSLDQTDELDKMRRRIHHLITDLDLNRKNFKDKVSTLKKENTSLSKKIDEIEKKLKLSIHNNNMLGGQKIGLQKDVDSLRLRLSNSTNKAELKKLEIDILDVSESIDDLARKLERVKTNRISREDKRIKQHGKSYNEVSREFRNNYLLLNQITKENVLFQDLKEVLSLESLGAYFDFGEERLFTVLEYKKQYTSNTIFNRLEVKSGKNRYLDSSESHYIAFANQPKYYFKAPKETKWGTRTDFIHYKYYTELREALALGSDSKRIALALFFNRKNDQLAFYHPVIISSKVDPITKQKSNDSLRKYQIAEKSCENKVSSSSFRDIGFVSCSHNMSVDSTVKRYGGILPKNYYLNIHLEVIDRNVENWKLLYKNLGLNNFRNHESLRAIANLSKSCLKHGCVCGKRTTLFGMISKDTCINRSQFNTTSEESNRFEKIYFRTNGLRVQLSYMKH